MKLTKRKNPDMRTLPAGWSQRYDEQQQLWFYVRDDVVPPIMTYDHPLGPKPGKLNHSITRQPSDETSLGDQSSLRASNTSGPSFAQQLYASAMKASTSPAPTEQTLVANTHRPNSGSGSPSARDLDTHKQLHEHSGPINLGAAAPPPLVHPTQNTYPPQLVTYLATSANPNNYSNPNEHSPVSSRALNTPQPVSAVTPSPVPSSTPKPTEPAPSGQSSAAMFYSSAIMPQNTQPKSAQPRPGSYSSRPSSSHRASTNAQEPAMGQNTPPQPMSAPPHQEYFSDPSNDVPHRTQSYQPTPVSSPPVTVLPRSSTFTAGGPPAPALSRTTVSFSARAPPMGSHQQSVTQPALASRASVPSPPFSAPGVQPTYNMPQQASVSVSSAPSSYSSPTTSYASPPVTFASPPASYSYPPSVSQSPSTTFSSPTSMSSTSGLSPSTSSQGPMPPTPQMAAPSRSPVVNQPATKHTMFSKNTMLGLAGGAAAAGIIGEVVFNDVLGGNNGGGVDMGGLIDGMGIGGGGDSGNGGLLDGMFNGGNGNGGGSGGDSTFQSFLDPSGQGSAPYFDPSNQGNGGGLDPTSLFDQSNQSNPYGQYQPQQQQQQHHSGPDYMHIAHQAYNKIHQYQQQHQHQHQQQHQQQQAAYQGGVPAGAGQAQQNPHWQAPLGAQYPPQHNSGYQAAHNAYHSTAPHGQAAPQSQHGQTYPQAATYQTTQPAQVYQQGQTYHPGQTYQGVQQGQQPPHHEGVRINATQVKQFAKGALIAGRIVAKMNGVNL